MTPTVPIFEGIDARLPLGAGGLFYGVYPARVVDITDPDEQGRVKVALPWAASGDGAPYEVWARLATMMAGNDRGTWFIPDVDDEVLVAFGGGDVARPFVVGALWNGADAPPASVDGGENNVKRIRSRNGVQITFDDTDGQEQIVIETPGGQVATLKDSPATIELRDSSGNTVTMEAAGVTVTTSAKLTVNASTVEVNASMVTVNSGMSKFSGVVQADTVITNSVVSASYTPGAGNIW